MRRWLLGLSLLGVGLAEAKAGDGTIAQPVLIDAFPYALKGTTVGAPSDVIDYYSCLSGLKEGGPEVIYAFQLTQPMLVTAWVEGDSGPVDIDIHLLEDLTVTNRTATGCVSRGNTIAEASLGPGTHYAVVDTYTSAAMAGAFVLRMHAIGDEWMQATIGQGVVWRARRYASVAGGPQVVHQLVTDVQVPGVSVKAVASAPACRTVSALVDSLAVKPVAAVNSGFFAVTAGVCEPFSLVKSGGAVLFYNSQRRGSFGLTQAQVPMVDLVSANSDWPAAYEAQGGVPLLVQNGSARQGTAAWTSEAISASNTSFIGINPRTWVGYDAAGRVLVGTVDGRRTNARGMSLDGLAAWLAGAEVGAVGAVNLDGGGSTTMWIAKTTPNGVVNYPSDAADQEQPNHPGSRQVSGAVLVYANPYNHPPRFQSKPVTAAAAGSRYDYDADALDLNVDDRLAYSLATPIAGAVLNPVTGELSFVPGADFPAALTVTVVATDDHGASTGQTFTLSISGTTGAGDAGNPTTPADAGAEPVPEEPRPEEHSQPVGCTSTPAGALPGLLLLWGLRRGSRR
ncbi:MAG: phosphodiester glycosidase family protein [Myxococcaceae bacterium]